MESESDEWRGGQRLQKKNKKEREGDGTWCRLSFRVFILFYFILFFYGSVVVSGKAAVPLTTCGLGWWARIVGLRFGG